jgi:hypothetical protein
MPVGATDSGQQIQSHVLIIPGLPTPGLACYAPEESRKKTGTGSNQVRFQALPMEEPREVWTVGGSWSPNWIPCKSPLLPHTEAGCWSHSESWEMVIQKIMLQSLNWKSVGIPKYQENPLKCFLYPAISLASASSHGLPEWLCPETYVPTGCQQG